MDGTDDGNGDRLYRRIIDDLVTTCRDGQGQIGPRRARSGLWNANATADNLRDQRAINVLLQRLSSQDRETLASLLEEAFVSGVHSALVTLHEAQVAPLDKAYEGTPFHDFVGRLGGWTWPESRSRS
jgi:transposase